MPEGEDEPFVFGRAVFSGRCGSVLLSRPRVAHAPAVEGASYGLPLPLRNLLSTTQGALPLGPGPCLMTTHVTSLPEEESPGPRNQLTPRPELSP